MQSTNRLTPIILIFCCLVIAGTTGCDKKPSSRGAAAGGGPGGGSSGGKPGGAGPRKFPVRTAVVSTQRVNYDIPAVGRLVEENAYRVPARVAGTAEKVLFKEGDRVTSGQELLRVDYERYRLMAEKARNELQEKQAEVAKAEAEVLDTQRETSSTAETTKLDYELAEADFRRRAELKQGAYVSAEERQQFEARYKRAATVYKSALAAAQTQTALAVASLNAARTALSAARVTLALAEDDLRNAVIRAPIDGVVQERTVVNGQYLQPGTTVALMVQTDPLRLRFTVPESKSAQLSRDMKVGFSVPAYPDKKFEAKVYDIGVVADPDTNEVQCWASVPNSEGELRPGYFTKVNIRIAGKQDAVVVPLGAVLPTEAGMVSYVIQDETAVRKRVQTGLQVTGDAIEILNGLTPGEQLVVEGVETLQDGVPVDIVNERPARNVSAGTGTGENTPLPREDAPGRRARIVAADGNTSASPEQKKETATQ